MSDTTFTEYFQQTNKQQFEDLMEQYKLLEEWGKKTFPEVQFRFEVNSDNVNHILNIKTTILTSNELNPNDRLFKTSTLSIPEKVWYNTVEVGRIIRSILPSNVQILSRVINEYYNKSKLIAQ